MANHEDRDAEALGELGQRREHPPHMLVLVSVRRAGDVGHQRVDDDELRVDGPHGFRDRVEVAEVW